MYRMLALNHDVLKVWVRRGQLVLFTRLECLELGDGEREAHIDHGRILNLRYCNHYVAVHGWVFHCDRRTVLALSFRNCGHLVIALWYCDVCICRYQMLLPFSLIVLVIVFHLLMLVYSQWLEVVVLRNHPSNSSLVLNVLVVDQK